MDELIASCGVTCLGVGIAGTHLLADQRTPRSEELVLEFAVEEAEHREVIPVVVCVVVIDVAVVYGSHEFLSETVYAVAVHVVGVKRDGACGVYLPHVLHHVGDDAELLFGSFGVGVKVVEFHLVVDGPEYHGGVVAEFLHHLEPFAAPEVEGSL